MWHNEFYPLWHGKWFPVNALAGLKIQFDPSAREAGWDPEAWTYIHEPMHLGPKTPEEAYRIRYSPRHGIDHLWRQVYIGTRRLITKSMIGLPRITGLSPPEFMYNSRLDAN